MNAPHFFQEAAAAHEELSTSPTVMGPDQNVFRPFMAQILTDSHTELLNVHFHSDSGNQACLRALMIYNAKKAGQKTDQGNENLVEMVIVNVWNVSADGVVEVNAPSFY